MAKTSSGSPSKHRQRAHAVGRAGGLGGVGSHRRPLGRQRRGSVSTVWVMWSWAVYQRRDVGGHEALGHLEAHAPGQLDAARQELPVDRDLQERHAGARPPPRPRPGAPGSGRGARSPRCRRRRPAGRRPPRASTPARRSAASSTEAARNEPGGQVGGVVALVAARIGVPEHHQAGDAEGVGRRLGLGRTTGAEALVAVEHVGAHQPGLTARGQHQDHPVPGGGRPGEGPGAEEGLVVGVGVEGHEGPAGHPGILAVPFGGVP